MSWPEVKQGWSWTHTHYENVINSDGSITYDVRVQGGPFYQNDNLWGIECYWLCRPTAPWTKGGNEGILVFWKRLMQRVGASNIAIIPTIRWAEQN